MKKIGFLLFSILLLITGNKVFASTTPFIKNNLVTIYTPVGIGSGSIIGKDGNTYYVLTAKHVVKGFKNDTLEIFTGDGEYWEALKPFINVAKRADDKSKTPIKNDLDVAIIKFKSNKCYPLGNVGLESYYVSMTIPPGEGSEIVVAGYATVDKSISTTPMLRVSNGKIATKIDNSDPQFFEKMFNSEGYQYGYTAPTARGMSGGPVYVDPDGVAIQRNVGGWGNMPIMIHGRGEADNLRGNNKTGFNFAIPNWFWIEALNAHHPKVLTKLNTDVYYLYEEDEAWNQFNLEELDAYDNQNIYPDGFEVAEGVCKPDGLIPIKPKNKENNNYPNEVKDIYNRLYK